MLRWSEVSAHQHRYEDLLAEARKPQLASWLLAGPKKRTRVHGRLLAWLGGRLVTLGTRLQVHEGNPIWGCTRLSKLTALRGRLNIAGAER